MPEITPLTGRPRCAKFPDLPCHQDCEFGIAGPCLNEIEDEDDA